MIFQFNEILRFIQIYIVQLSVGGILFILMAILILRRSTKKLNQIVAMFFISIALSTIVNVVYAPLRISVLMELLNILAYFLFNWAMVYLLLLNLLILRSTKLINSKIQIALIVIWTIILVGLFPIGLLDGVRIDGTTNWRPVWNLLFLLYGLGTGLFCMVIPTIYYSIKVYKSLGVDELEKRWRLFIAGMLFYYIIWAGVSIVNFVADEIIRTIWGAILLISFSAIYILYYGIAKQLQE
ncbi:MAG: hypothetical protein GF311_06710 [Candidatus Lokiarchaeota archaeon]|nr:hypothetical protein [Candidatus Lokiarchaeota archaeon]